MTWRSYPFYCSAGFQNTFRKASKSLLVKTKNGGLQFIRTFGFRINRTITKIFVKLKSVTAWSRTSKQILDEQKKNYFRLHKANLFFVHERIQILWVTTPKKSIYESRIYVISKLWRNLMWWRQKTIFVHEVWLRSLKALEKWNMSHHTM